MLETFLSGGSFTDLLSEVELLHRRRRAGQGRSPSRSRRTRRRSPPSTRRSRTRGPRTDDLRLETAAQKVKLDAAAQGPEGGQGRAASSSRPRRPSAPRDPERRPTPSSPRNKTNARQGARRRRPRREQQLAAQDQRPRRAASTQQGNIPSKYNGTLGWPMTGHGHPGLRLHRRSRASRRSAAAPTSTRASTSSAPYGHAGPASGDGTVVYIGWNYADGADPAWIVIIAHSVGPRDLVRPHDSRRYPVAIHAGAARSKRARSSATRATPATRPAPTSTGRSSSTATS